MAERPAAERPLTTGRLIIAISVFVVVGFPMVYVLWDALNHLLGGQLRAIRPWLVLPVLIVFAAFVYLLSRFVRRWERR